MERIGASAKSYGCAKPRVVNQETRNSLKLIQKSGGNVRASALFVKVNGIGDILACSSVHGSLHVDNRARS